MVYGTLTPHALGMEEIAPGLRPLTLAASCFRQLHAACRSAVLCAAAFRLRTPLQQPAGGVPVPERAYAMHWERSDDTWPQVIAASVPEMTTVEATRARRRVAATRAI